jgi:signal transduction histidine kinase
LNKRPPAKTSFPFGAFWTILAVVCLALGFSAAHSYSTLSGLRTEYLTTRGGEVAKAIEQQTRGPGRHRNREVWQEVIESVLEQNREQVSYIFLLDSEGENLASAGKPDSEAESFAYKASLEQGRGRGWGNSRGLAPAEWNIEIGLYSASADFITRQAKSHAVIAGIAIVTLLGLGFYFTYTLRKFLALKSREESERHLASLGAMSATLAHEIRNPLGAMKGLTQVVQEDLPEGHRSQEMMKTVIEEAERLEQLVTDLLAFAKPVELRLSAFDLAEMLAEVAGFLAPQAEDSGVLISIPDEVPSTFIRSDQDGIRQVLLNLILNGVEASPRDSEVKVRLVSTERTGQVRVEIRDCGPGLGEFSSEELFLPFKTTKLKGSGLGLAASKRIADRLGGRISLENIEGGGTLCTLEIPSRSPQKV